MQKTITKWKYLNNTVDNIKITDKKQNTNKRSKKTSEMDTQDDASETYF